VAGDPHRFDDLFLEFGHIALRRFFGGEGIYVDGVLIGAVFRDRIYLKTDYDTRKAYLHEGCEPFSFSKRGRGVVETRWFALPDRLYDDPEELAHWARAALNVAARTPKVERERKEAKRKKAFPKKTVGMRKKKKKTKKKTKKN
jgi:DNA transformation protein